MSSRHQKRSASGRGFIAIPHVVMESDDYRRLPPYAVKLLNAMVFQYRGKNNGDLTAAYKVMRNWGFVSKDTLSRAIKDLISAKLIVRTREGQFSNPGGGCALYALTWHAIDECPGKRLTIGPTNRPWRQFSMEKQNTRTNFRARPDPNSGAMASKS